MIRRYLFRLLLLCLPFLSFSLHAETIAATPKQAGTDTQPATQGYVGWNNLSHSTFASACNSIRAGYGGLNKGICADDTPLPWTDSGASLGYCRYENSPGQCATMTANGIPGRYNCPSGYTRSGSTCTNSTTTYVCPTTGGWTLSGTSCTRPDCPNGATRQPDGSCMSACQEVASLLNGTTAWYSVPVGSGQAMGSYCDSGCAVTLGVAGTGYYTDGKNNSFQRTKHYSGSSCASEPNAPAQFTPEKPKPPVPEKKPPCAAGEGVMTSSSGTIGCVPEGTPNSNPPVVKKEKETKTNADGTTATTETTTTRDPSTGVEQKTSTTTTKDANGNTTGVTSSSGTTGTTTAGNPEKPGDSDFCQKNPGLDICKGNLNKEETQKEVRDELKKLTDPGSTSTDPLKNATHTTESENQLKAENDKFTDAAKGITDPTATSKTSWQQAMESGWFSAIPHSGCTPITGTVGGRQFTIDHCEKASQISDIMSYALWFMLVVGSFVMFTGGQLRTQ